MSKPETKKCNQCGEEVLKEAKKCKHCQTDLRSWARRHPIYTLFIVIMVLGIFMSSLPGSGTGTNSIDNVKTTQPTESDYEDAAAICAQGKMKELLKSPSTAKFPWELKATKVSEEDHSYLVENYVDSQNSFGAMIRTNYSCAVKVIDALNFECQVSCGVVE